ncbi:hypothetical protein KBC79_01360 [Candidatus Woesebacteria bacterium]|nr:hypothetical protein [Candidatus Woesebacteria bacterium]
MQKERSTDDGTAGLIRIYFERSPGGSEISYISRPFEDDSLSISQRLFFEREN